MKKLINDPKDVVAESVAEGHGTFLGLRYPAIDIPPRARELYLRNRVRLIPDVHAAPAPLVSAAGPPDTVDLSDATLRAVSPVHLEYLRNMGVRASASLALVVDGSLWGSSPATATPHPGARPSASASPSTCWPAPPPPSSRRCPRPRVRPSAWASSSASTR